MGNSSGQPGGTQEEKGQTRLRTANQPVIYAEIGP